MGKVSKYKKRYIIIVILAIATIYFIFFSGSFINKTKVIELKDRCGPFMGSILHTIQDEATCSMRCTAQCDGMNMKVKKVIFTDETNQCYICSCYCIDEWW